MRGFVDGFEAYLARMLSTEKVEVADARRIPGGFSRHTWSTTVRADGDERRLVVRFDPEASLLESNRTVEYAMYAAFGHVAGVPVPSAVVNEDDPGPLGRPFMCTEQVDGSPDTGELADIERATRRGLGTEAMEVLGRIGRADWRALGLGQVLDVPDRHQVWEAELNRWEAALDEHDLGPMPVTRAAIRWLRRNPPPPPPHVGVVHGDFRCGNLLFADGRLTAVLDWEMAHLGDPLEDLAWYMLENWRYDPAHPEDPGGLMSRDETIAAWEASAGRTVDPDALRWWQLLSHVKAVGIWNTGAHNFASGETADVMLALIPWFYNADQEGWMLELLGVESP